MERDTFGKEAQEGMNGVRLGKGAGRNEWGTDEKRQQEEWNEI